MYCYMQRTEDDTEAYSSENVKETRRGKVEEIPATEVLNGKTLFSNNLLIICVYCF